MDISQNNRIDLLYLTNPNFKNKYNKQLMKRVNDEDIKFYRKRILQDTKDLLRGNKLGEEVNAVFDKYCGKLIDYYKFIDKKTIIQEEYKDLPIKKEKVNENFKLEIENEKLMNKPDVVKKTIKDFIPIVVKERKKKKMILPKQKNFDLKNPKNRQKEKSNQFISNDKNKKKKEKNKKEKK